MSFSIAFNAMAVEVTAVANFAKSIKSDNTLRNGGTFIQVAGTEKGIVKFDIASHGIPSDATITSATLRGTTKSIFGSGTEPAVGKTDLKTQAEIDAITTFTAFPAVTLIGSGSQLKDTEGGEVQNFTIDVTSMVAESILDANSDLVVVAGTLGSGAQLYTYNATQVAANQHMRIDIEYTVPQGTALLTPSHVKMHSKGVPNADGATKQVFTLTNTHSTGYVKYDSTTTTFTAAPTITNDCPVYLAPGDNCEITIVLDSSGDADKAALVKVKADGVDSVAYVYQYESIEEQAKRRAPPVAFSSSIKFNDVEIDRTQDLDAEAGNYTFSFDLESYNTDYSVWLAIYDCTPAQISDESCGNGTPLKSTPLIPTAINGSANYTGKDTFNATSGAPSYSIPSSSKIASMRHNFSETFEIPAYNESGTSLVGRLFYREGVDEKIGNRAVSVLFMGANLHEGGIDSLGRKIVISQ
ncbi:hypothetical protein [Thalassomonas sp. M1454]|uniref:hypothetical protein n=1 Tax=Thalassomonas sp. M1454 TaxID=2594477 RepID=UPI00117EAED0|nr:hypothetical protein [Thalassomonas sp. M1454]TRX57209.1 hypothetical protein FNN08_06835 [Thalassomonas sp. M1454]